jgi:Uma2 family endonuclease
MATSLPDSVAPNETRLVLPEGAPYRLSVEEYFRMVELDIIGGVGLWKGHLYEKEGKDLSHSTVQALIVLALSRVLPSGWFLYLEKPIFVDYFTVPSPSLAIIRGEPMMYYRRDSVPTMKEAGLVIEIGGTSRSENLNESLQTYARAGLPVYWVVNLVENRVEVYSDPNIGTDDAAGYGTREAFGPGTEIPLVLDGQEAARVPASQLLLEGTD